MNNFTVMTDAQLAAHDASTSKRYQAAAQEAQATIAKQATRIAALEAHIRKFTNRHSEAAAMPDDQSPYPGMAKAFEVHYGVSWTDRDWRNEQSTWAAAWRMAWDRRATVLDAEQDAARLDFLDSIGAAYGFEDTHEGNRWMIDGPFNSLRAAIDAAIDAAIEKGGA